MFYCAEALLLAKGLTFSSHRAVISAFAQHFIKAGVLPKHLHQWLREAFEKRQVSEYEFLTGAGRPDVADLLEKARRFLQATDEQLRLQGCI